MRRAQIVAAFVAGAVFHAALMQDGLPGGGLIGAAQAARGAAREAAIVVLAWVNKAKIPATALQEAGTRVTGEGAGGRLTEAQKQEILDKLIEQELLYQQALVRGYDLDSTVKKVMVNILLREEVYAQVKNSDFTDAELRAYFDAHREEFIVPEKRQIRAISVSYTKHSPAEARQIIEAARAEVLGAPEAFKEVAARVSEDIYKRRGGDIGFVSAAGKPGFPQAVVDRAFSLEVAQLSEVFEAEGALWIIRVEAHRDRLERDFEQMKGSVLRKVKSEHMAKLYDAYIAELVAAAKIRKDPEALRLLEVMGNGRTSGFGVPPSPEEEEEEVEE